MSIEPIFSLAWWGAILGGLGIFLLSINLLGDALKKMAGAKLKTLIDRFTSTPLKGVFVGFLITTLIQSSSATTALSIGLIKAGLMTLPQAVGVIIGSNVGSTVTSFLIGLDISKYAPFILLIGALIMVFSNRQRTKYAGEAIFAFGALFFGLTLMSASLGSLAELPQFESYITSLGQKPLLGVLVGALGTAALQSSSAFIGILQTLYEAGSGTGASLAFAIPIIFGSNIGTTITGIMAAFGGSTEAKRAAALHTAFNFIGTIVFFILLKPYIKLISWISSLLHLSPKMEIAFAHIIFNLLTAILLMFFINQLVKLISIAFKQKPSEKEVSLEGFDLSFLNRSITNVSPQIALEVAKQQAIVMAELVAESIDEVKNYFLDGTLIEAHKKVLKIEETVDRFNIKLTNFLNSIETTSLTEKEIHNYGAILKAFRDIERMSDHCENLLEFFEEFHKQKDEIHEDAQKDIIDMLDLTMTMVKNATLAYKERNIKAAKQVLIDEDKLDFLYKDARNRHVSRLALGQDSGSKYISIIFVDLISNIERIGDHCVNLIETN